MMKKKLPVQGLAVFYVCMWMSFLHVQPVYGNTSYIDIGISAYESIGSISFSEAMDITDSEDNFIYNSTGKLDVYLHKGAYLLKTGFRSREDVNFHKSMYETAVYMGNGAWGYGYIYESYEEALDKQQNYPDYSIFASRKALLLKNQGENICLFLSDGNLILKNKNGYLQAGSHTYRGNIKIQYVGEKISLINTLELEAYLYSVVPSEMPAQWHEEALKAQALAARTYAKRQMGAHKSGGYDLCDTVHCQVYTGMKGEHERTTKAVDDTRGLAIYYNGKTIDAVFSSSSGGYTDHSENVWNEALPYLRSVKDTYDTTGKVWTRTTTLTEISASLIKNGIHIGALEKMSIEKADTGRVQKIIFSGSTGTAVIEKERVRTIFDGIPGGSLESRLFAFGQGEESSQKSLVYVASHGGTTIHPIDDLMVLDGQDIQAISKETEILSTEKKVALSSLLSSGNGSLVWSNESVIISGKGWGHGVGLSQHGAKGMAEAGFTYPEIIAHYYQGVVIE